jgi:hypothetical protein
MKRTKRRSKPGRKEAKTNRNVLEFKKAPAPLPARSFGEVGRSLLSGVSSLFTVGGPRKAASQHDSAPASPRSGVGSAASREVSPHLPSLRHSDERAGAFAASSAQNPPREGVDEEKTARAPEKEEESAAPTQAALAPSAAVKEENASPLSRAPQKEQESAATAQAGLATGRVLPSATGSSPTAISTSSALDAGEGGGGGGGKGETSSIYIFKGKRNGPQPRKFDMFHGDSPACAPKVASLSVCAGCPRPSPN